MALFEWFDGNQGIFRYKDFSRDFEITGDDYSGAGSSGTITLGLNGTREFDPARSPFSIEVDFEDAVKKKGTFREGTITEVRFLNEDGDVLMQGTGLDAPLGAMQAFFTRDNSNFWDVLSAGGHTFQGAEDGSGTDNDWEGDDIKSGSGNDTVYGNGGDDYIEDNGGADKYYGGNKDSDDYTFDTLTYQEWFWDPRFIISGIDVRLDKNKIEGPDGFTDKVFGIETVRGTFLDDRFTGDGENNHFWGLGGKDFFDGKDGWDTLRYDRDDDWGGNDGVTVDFAKGKAVDGFGITEKFRNMEAARGSDFDDTFISSQTGNYFRGEAGDDTFIFGKNGKGSWDTAEGGDGADRFVINGKAFRLVEIDDFDVSEDFLEISSVKRKKDVSFGDDGNGNTLITFKGNEVLLHGVAVGDFGFDDLA